VKGILRDNIDKAYKRGEDLENVQGKTKQLEEGAGLFRKQAHETQRRMWLKDMKYTLIVILVVLLILAAIIGSFSPS